uniref:Nucleoporin SEH1 n=1 Tax=Plectus sambesii TaxID=2011161 RepID=A0A914UNS9_9BILA
AAGCDDPNAQGSRVTIFEYNDSLRKWFKVETLPEVSDPVCDVAFAPSVGRSYHLLAVASRNVHIFSLKPLQSAIADSDIPSDSATSKFSVKELASFDEHGGQVWRVSWNITGTVLSSAGSDGTIKVWKTNYMNSWKLVSSLRPHEQGIEQDAVLAPFNVHEGQHYY